VVRECAHEPTVAKPPAIDRPTVGAHEASRPAKPLEVVETRCIIRELGLKLANGPRVVHPSPRVNHVGRLRRSIGEQSSSWGPVLRCAETFLLAACTFSRSRVLAITESRVL
jgi:hypothetical protein